MKEGSVAELKIVTNKGREVTLQGIYLGRLLGEGCDILLIIGRKEVEEIDIDHLKRIGHTIKSLKRGSLEDGEKDLLNYYKEKLIYENDYGFDTTTYDGRIRAERYLIETIRNTLNKEGYEELERLVKINKELDIDDDMFTVINKEGYTLIGIGYSTILMTKQRIEEFIIKVKGVIK